ncbi:hypothetical protein [Mesorhizobium atlanticum]|uniref:hypothetical protein n=1 Tax=Mesorhizobium atlanticum TaxID=2233532 RepID=UPI0015EC80B4|nr:hypothetical protein [Mesorhizobium atlanticum]
MGEFLCELPAHLSEGRAHFDGIMLVLRVKPIVLDQGVTHCLVDNETGTDGLDPADFVTMGIHPARSRAKASVAPLALMAPAALLALPRGAQWQHPSRNNFTANDGDAVRLW